MCGVARDKAGESDIVPPLEATMPPSITLGSEPPKPASGPGDHPPQQEPPVSKDIPTIDLSKDENDDIEKAIRLSLQDQQVPATLTGISAEDQEVSRALEASLKESTPQATIDLINPQDRKRQLGVPVGLKNIGNSCWFNVIIQPLFHIPVFRDMILNFSQNVDTGDQMEETQKSSRQLVPALRKLFSLMIGSNRKYIDPTFAVHIFQGQEMRKNSQQDVCEFTHKLLERLEEEYHQLLRRQGVEKESECYVSKDADFENPIMRLFYGHTKKENCEEDDDGPKQETFGQYPLHIMNYSSIHESILGSMVSTMPDMTGDTVEPVHQETWFKLLPPVLIFSLSRYEYSVEKKRAEKVHNKFEFPELLYMDRYMEINKKMIKEKHIKVAKLKGELNTLTKTLDRYEKYGSGEAKYPIGDILKYTLDFAQTGINSGQSSDANYVPSPSMMEVDGVETSENDVEMAEAPEVKKETSESLVCEKSSDADLPLVEEASQVITDPIKEERSSKEPTQENTPSEKEESPTNCSEDCNPRTLEEEHQQMSSPSKRMRILPPAPRNITNSELSILQSCLSRWLQDINAQVSELRRCITDLEMQLDQMYDDPVLQRIPYRLHSVVVHEGQASGGHYWVYIFDSVQKVWMKFNDIQVVESNWEELLQDSVGGQNNASAYCLLYIDESRYEMIFPQPPETMDTMMSNISLDLQECVKNDNMVFARELEEWELKHEKHEQGKEEHVARVSSRQLQTSTDPSWDNTGAQVPATAPNSPDIICVEDADENNFFIQYPMMLTQTIEDSLIKEGALQGNHGSILNAILVREMSRLNGVVTSRGSGIYSDPSLLDFGVYLIRNLQNAEILLKWYGCEIVWQVAQNIYNRTPLVDRVIKEASQCLQQVKDNYQESCGAEYRAWKRHYQTLIECTCYLSEGFKLFKKGNLEASLPMLLRACKLHVELAERPPMGNRKTLDKEVFWKARRICILTLSERLVHAFINKEVDEVSEIKEIVVTLVVPTLNRLVCAGGEEDNETAAEIRQIFCRLLECELCEDKRKLREQILVVVLNGGTGDTRGIMPCQALNPIKSLSLYKEYAEHAASIMSLTVKSKAQTSDL